MSLTPFMVRSGVARAPAELGSWLRREGFDVRGEPDHKSEMARWLDKSSIRLSELEPGVIEAALTRATTRMDGQAMSANDIMAMVDFTKAGPKASRRYAALFACVGIAGMRPSEAMALRVEDLTLPHRGWGMAMLRGATTSPGARYTNTAGVHEDKQLKQRAVGAVRPAPLAPVLVGCLRQHLVEFPAGDRVFTTSRGTPMSTTSYSEAWKKGKGRPVVRVVGPGAGDPVRPATFGGHADAAGGCHACGGRTSSRSFGGRADGDVRGCVG